MTEKYIPLSILEKSYNFYENQLAVLKKQKSEQAEILKNKRWHLRRSNNMFDHQIGLCLNAFNVLFGVIHDNPQRTLKQLIKEAEKEKKIQKNNKDK